MDPIDNYCFKCGECCTQLKITVTQDELDILRSITNIPIPVSKTNGKYMINGNCPLLTPSKTCSVYDSRPCQCRLYHCGRLNPKGEKLGWISDIQRLMSVNLEYRVWRTQMEDEAVKWGNERGWSWRRKVSMSSPLRQAMSVSSSQVSPLESSTSEKSNVVPADEVPAAVEKQLRRRDPYYKVKFAAAVGVVCSAIAYKYAPLLAGANYV